MSTDWKLFSVKHKKQVTVGSDGLSGVQSYPQEATDFIRWAIENNVDDIVLAPEHDVRLEDLEQ